MYCPVYGCTSDFKKNKENSMNFFHFRSHQVKRKLKDVKNWIEFCRRKKFEPTKCTCLCSLHFTSDTYLPSHSPDFLKSIFFSGKRKLTIKPDPVPMISKPIGNTTNDYALETKKRSTGILARKKVGKCK